MDTVTEKNNAITLPSSTRQIYIRNLSELAVVVGIYLSIFINSYVFFRTPFEFYLGYLIYIILLPYQIKKFGINKNLFFILLILLVNGICMIVFGYNTPDLFFKVYLGIFLSYIFYDNVIRMFDFELDRLFRWYLKGALWVCYIGIFQVVCWKIGFKSGYSLFGIFNKWSISPGGLMGIRINSVFPEPTHFGAFIAAAFFVSVYTLLPIQKNIKPYYKKKEAIVVFLVYFLTGSGLAQGGILLTLIIFFLHFGLIRYLVVLIPIIAFMFNVIYQNVNEFRERWDGLIDLYLYDKFILGKTHGSSFILYNNFHVATDNFWNNPLFGTGIGSHPIAFEKYSLAKDIKVYGFQNNSQDANSMFLRLISETGLFGTLLFLYLIVKCFVRKNPGVPDDYWVISSACLVIILLNLFRQGHYFFCGFPFYVLLYYYNKIKYKEWESNQKSADHTLSSNQDNLNK